MRTGVKIMCIKNKWGNVWKVARKRKRWNSLNFYVYARHFINCPCFNYEHKIYVRTHVKISLQWKSTLPLQFCLLKLIGEDPRGGVFAILFSSPPHAASPPTNVARVVFKSSYNVCRLWVLPRMQAHRGTFNGSRSKMGQGKGVYVFESFPWPHAPLKAEGFNTA